MITLESREIRYGDISKSSDPDPLFLFSRIKIYQKSAMQSRFFSLNDSLRMEIGIGIFIKFLIRLFSITPLFMLH